jgi:hypothetical protein
VKTPAPERAASRKRLAAKGQALKDGTAPVPDLAYLRKAIRAKGRVDPAKWPALKRLIIRRARQLKATSAPGVKGTWAFQGANRDGTAITLTGDGHGRHVAGTPMVYEHGYIPVSGTVLGKDGIRRPGGSGHAKATPGVRGKGARAPAVKAPAPVKPPAVKAPLKAAPKVTPKAAAQDYPKMSAKEAEKWGSDGWPSTSPPLPRDQYEALRDYSGAGYTEINGYLRNGKPKGSAALRKSIASIDKAMAGHPTPSKATVVHRGIDLDAFGGVAPDKLIGHDVREPGFLSTSAGAGVADGFWHHEAHVEIKVPAGTPAFYMDGLTGAKGERELLLARGLQYKILGARKNPRTGKWMVQAEIVPAAIAHANDDTEAISLATTTRRMPVVRGPADVQLSRSAPGMITAQHKTSGMKIGVITPEGKGYAGKHADGTPTGASGSQQGALAGLIAHHNKRAQGFPAAQQDGTASYAGDQDGAVDLAGALPFTSAATSGDGPRVTAMGAGKPAATAKPAGGLSPDVAAIYRKLLAKGMKPAQAMAMAKRAAAMHAKASAA